VTDQTPAPEAPAPKPKGRVAWLALLPLGVLLALVAAAVTQLTRPDPAPATFGSPIRPAPAIEAQLIGGGTVNFAKLDGPKIVNFWAPWCVPCRAEHPFLLAMEEQGIPILGVLHMDTNDKADPAAAVERGKAVLAREDDPFVSVPVDSTGDISLGFGISGVPETFLVDANGQIIKTMRGPIVDNDTMQAFIDAWRAEVKKAGG
jgi:cytochrome c biogenesis protein CcmG/thiol:disulfide interchange protein DsbE